MEESCIMDAPVASPLNPGDLSELEALEVYVPKQTSIRKAGGILCHICGATLINKKEFLKHYSQHDTGDAEIIYSCVVCKKQFSGYPSLRGHCYLHVVKDKYQCKHCSKGFPKLSYLNNHITAVHEFKCSLCDEKFASKIDLHAHKILHSRKAVEEPPYECTICKKDINTVDDCETHIDEHIQTLYPCPICSKEFPTIEETTNHLTIHFDESVPSDISETITDLITEDTSIDIVGGILCFLCEKLFKNRSEIDNHFALKHEDKTVVYTCNICLNQYDKYMNFGTHCHNHLSKDRFQCEQCIKTFPRLSLLVIHTEAFHSEGAGEKPFKCEQCGHAFMSRHRLRSHMRLVHDRDEDIKCSWTGCTATFETPRELIQHKMGHRAGLGAWCRACGLQLGSLRACAGHAPLHRRARYSCPVCARAYPERRHLRPHLPAHFHATLHVCKLCAKAFRARNRLMAHMKTHEARRAHTCALCGKGFLKPYLLAAHASVHSGCRPYACALCPRAFTNYPNWSKHLVRVHKLDRGQVLSLKARHDAAALPPPAAPAPPAPAPAPVPAPPAPAPAPAPAAPFDSIDVQEMDTLCDPVTGEILSVTDTVNAVIERIELEEELAPQPPASPFPREAPPDDSSDIEAIVQHIDALRENMEAERQPETTDELQFAEMMPVDNTVFTTIPDDQTSAAANPYYQVQSFPPDYCVSVTDQAAELAYGTNFISLDHTMPHIDPKLTIKSGKDKKYVQTLDNFNYDTPPQIQYESPKNWEPPILTKVFSYEETNDVNRIFVLNTNIF